MSDRNNTPNRSSEPLGVYIHLPFCKSKCPYCDFCSFPRPQASLMSSYVSRLTEIIRSLPPSITDRPVDTVYFGGGTPTLIPLADTERLLSSVRECFCILPDAEITLECNPATADLACLSVWHQNGVNRLSMGAQSAHDIELKALGRLHTWADVCRTVQDARTVGIQNINVDFMMGIPHQTPESLQKTLYKAINLAPEHLSAYCLMLEDGTPFARRGAKALGIPDDDGMADLFEMASSVLTAYGYEHYEISNYARPGKRSRHNLHTWQGHEYLGLGVAAHGYVNGVRYGNSRDLESFLAGKDITDTRYVLTNTDRAEELIMLGLRLSDGIDLAALSKRFGFPLTPALSALLDRLSNEGLCIRNGYRIALTDRGFLISNAVISAIMEACFDR